MVELSRFSKFYLGAFSGEDLFNIASSGVIQGQCETMSFLDKMFIKCMFDIDVPIARREALAKRAAILFCAERHNQYLLPMLSSACEERRQIASILLGFKDNIVVLPALKAGLRDNSARVRSGAVIGISNLRGGRLDGVLAAIIMNIFESEDNIEVIGTALRSLKYFVHPSCAQIFLDYLGYPDDEIKLSCLSGLFFVCRPTFLPAIRLMFASNNSRIRKKAVELFERYGDRGDLSALLLMTKDNNALVAKAARRAIQTIELLGR